MSSPDSSRAQLEAAEYFADIEGLTGAARARFLRLLRQTFWIKAPTPGRHWITLLIGAAFSGPVCLFLEFRGSHALALLAVCVWLGCSAVGVTLALACRRAVLTEPKVEPEMQWRVYCLLVRPVLLAECPGLLDRNLPADKSEREKLVVKPLTTLQLMFLNRGSDLWWSTLWGLWVGMVGALLCRGFFPSAPAAWAFVLPASGLVAGPVAWALWEYWAFSRVQRESSK